MSSIRSSRRVIYRLTLDAMFVALNVLFGLLPSEISWQSLPVLLAAFLFSPGDAVTVAVLGSFIEQIRFGLSAVSLLWMMPWLVVGLFAGLGAYVLRRHERVWKIVLVVVISELLLSTCNTVALLATGSLLLDLSSPWLIVVAFATRIPQALIRSILSAVVVPLLLPPVRRALAKTRPSSTNS